jgi:hypothetical protein
MYFTGHVIELGRFLAHSQLVVVRQLYVAAAATSGAFPDLLARMAMPPACCVRVRQPFRVAWLAEVLQRVNLTPGALHACKSIVIHPNPTYARAVGFFEGGIRECLVLRTGKEHRYHEEDTGQTVAYNNHIKEKIECVDELSVQRPATKYDV